MRITCIGLVTLDVVHFVPRLPRDDEKLVATHEEVGTGGPAGKAAMTSAALGKPATLIAAFGKGPLADMVRHELATFGVDVPFVDGDVETLLPISSIIVTEPTGARAVVSTNAHGRRLPVPADLDALLDRSALVCVDGHQMPLAVAAAGWARGRGIPVVVDAGSWRDGMDALLAHATHVICSESFRPPACTSPSEVLSSVASFGADLVAVTHGARPIEVRHRGGVRSIEVPTVAHVVDTLGAGDVLHGAFCAFLLETPDPVVALDRAASIAAESVTRRGTRDFLQDLRRKNRPV